MAPRNRRAGPGPDLDGIDADLRGDPEDLDGEDAASPPLTDELDLHTFRPGDVQDLVDEYLRAARDAGMTTVRIVHGKGTGALRRTVHAVLDRHPAVRAYRLADERSGSWGATLVELQPPAD
ncbi:MAG TPA: Smr/MutS family protein [Kofleriaceae bacterium]|nr:Smr/MutS family protein [Kofleriaceae bacterium]